MKLTIRNHKTFRSTEGQCSQGMLYIDGKRACFVSDDAHGGPMHFDDPDVERRIDAYALTLPPRVADFVDPKTGRPFEYPMSAETVVSDLFVRELYKKDMKRAFSRRVVFVDGDVGRNGLAQSNDAPNKRTLDKWLSDENREELLSILGTTTDRILNLMDPDDALDMWIAASKPQ